MCYRPITIANNVIDFNSGIHPVYQSFPCGKCYSCLQHKRDDIAVRAYYEWKRIHDSGKGQMYYLTLTFADEDVPMFESAPYIELLSPFGELPDVKVKSFDHKAFSNFMKKLRVYTERYYQTTVRVFAVSEFGTDEEATHRPHYHCIFITGDAIEPTEFKSVVEMAWSKNVKKSEIPQLWLNACDNYFAVRGSQYYNPLGKDYIGRYCAHRHKNGNISYQRKFGFVREGKHGIIVQDCSLIPYLTKYLEKDKYYMEIADVSVIYKFLSHLPQINEIERDYSPDVVKALKELKNIFPFTVYPKGFGSLLFDELDTMSQLALQHDKAVKMIVENRVFLPNDTYAYRIPTYIINKLFYNVHEIPRISEFNVPSGNFQRTIVEQVNTKKRVYTALAKECLTMRSKLARKTLSNEIKGILNPLFLSDFVNLSTVIGDERKQYEFMYCMLPKNIDFDLLAVYKLHFQNISKDLYRKYDMNSLTSQQWINLADGFLAWRIDYNDVISNNASSPCKNATQLNFLTQTCGLLNNLPIFEKYDLVLAFVDFVKKHLSIAREKKIEQDKEIVRKVRGYFNYCNFGC